MNKTTELTKDIITLESDIEVMDESINFYIALWSDKILDRFVPDGVTASEDGWFNVYVDYFPETRKVLVTTILDERETSESWEEEIFGEEKEILLECMNEYCIKVTDMNMDNYWKFLLV